MKTLHWLVLTLILTLLLALWGCGAGTAPSDIEDDPEQPEVTEPVQSEPEVVSLPTEIRFERQEGGDAREWAVITALDEEGETLWTVTTDKYMATELYQTGEIGSFGAQYLYMEGGAIVARALTDGAQLWRNEDFQGFSLAWDAGEDGTVYLCGYYGPDFYAISQEGETLARIDTFDPDYWWAHQIVCTGSAVEVTLDGSPDEEPEVFTVDLSDYTYTH